MAPSVTGLYKDNFTLNYFSVHVAKVVFECGKIILLNVTLCKLACENETYHLSENSTLNAAVTLLLTVQYP